MANTLARAPGALPVDIQIVGVVRDAKHTTVRSDIHRTVYTPYLQDEQHLQDHGPGQKSSTCAPGKFLKGAESTIRQAMRTLDSSLVLNHFRTMQEQIDNNLNGERVVAFLAASFGALAVFMAAIGIYGVLAYSTAQRTREIGIRIAVGATRGAVARIVVTEVSGWRVSALPSDCRSRWCSVVRFAVNCLEFQTTIR